MSDLFSTSKLFSKDGTEQSSQQLAGKMTGLYFSAKWCPSCRQFTPLLAQFYGLLRRDQEPFEIVYVSRDRSYEVHSLFFVFGFSTMKDYFALKESSREFSGRHDII